MMKQLLLVAGISILGLGTVLSSRSIAAPPFRANDERVCPEPSLPGLKACHAHRLLDHRGSMAVASGAASQLAAPDGYGPADLQAAYNLASSSAGAGTGRTVAIVVAQDGPTVEADLGVYRAMFGLTPCTTANGCFRKINQDGAASPLPSADPNWASEMNLQLDMISAVCPNCNIVLVEATSALDKDLDQAVNMAALQTGVVAISNPWGGAEDSASVPTCSAFFQHPGIAVVASAGDNGIGTSSPASCPYVTAVGGTSLVRSSAVARGWTETVWGPSSTSGQEAGTGSGCSSFIAKPAWQTDIGCTKRTTNDVAIVADTDTGVAAYDQGGWIVYGGTSVGAGLISGVYGLASAALPGDYPVTYAYANPGALFDITQGNNGSCSPLYLCNAGVGYDGPSGLGTPNGVAAFGPSAPSSDFSLSAAPSSISVTQAASGSSTITTVLASGTTQTIRLSVAGLPAGATASFASTTITAGGNTTMTINSGTAAVGTYSLTVSALGTSAAHSTSLTLVVTSPPDFSISANPGSLTIVQGASGSTAITSTVVSGSAQSVTLAVSGLPSGASAIVSPGTITAGGGATLAISAGTAVPGNYTLSVIGTGVSVTHAAAINLTITAPPADFILAVSASTQTKSPGSIGFVTITVTGIHGFDATVKLGVTGFPPGISGIVLPNSVTGSGNAYLLYLVGPRQPVGSFPITVTGVSGSLFHSVGVTVNVK